MRGDMTSVESRGLQARLDELWDFEDPAGSEARLRQAAAGEATDLGRGVLATQVARALGLQGRYADALEALDAVASDHRELTVRALLERGRVLNSRGDRDAARPQFEAAFELAREHGFENLAVDALHMIAIVAPKAEKEALHERAIALAAGASDPRARQWLGSLYNNLGWSHFEAGDVEGALSLFERALDERLLLGRQRQIDIARWAVARALRALGRTDEALSLQQAILDSTTGMDIVDPFVHAELAECLSTLGLAEEAKGHATRALEALADDPTAEAQMVARLREIAGLR
jgi:tetratricopeptide (TPR) repeat protein